MQKDDYKVVAIKWIKTKKNAETGQVKAHLYPKEYRFTTKKFYRVGQVLNVQFDENDGKLLKFHRAVVIKMTPLNVNETGKYKKLVARKSKKYPTWNFETHQLEGANVQND